MLYFVAFGFLFAFVIPMLIGTLIREEDQIADQMGRGVDPTVILEETGAGKPGMDCNPDGYQYLVSGDGYRYVRQQNNPYIAALIDDDIVILVTSKGDDSVVSVLDVDQYPVDVSKLSRVLSVCLQGNKVPENSNLMLGN